MAAPNPRSQTKRFRPAPADFVGIGLSLLIGLAALLVAGETQADDQRRFGFGSREIYEFKHRTSGLVFHDLDRDGRDDIVFINNRMSRLEVLIRKDTVPDQSLDDLPALEDHFSSHGFLLEQKTAYLAVRDLNGDQQPDILTAGTQLGLRIYTQNATGRFEPFRSPHVKKTGQLISIGTADFDGDGHLDILVCRRTDAEVLYNDGRGRFQRRRPLAFTAPDCEGAMIGDFDGDGHPDVLARFPKEPLALRLFRGLPTGGFGWEHPLGTPPLKAIEPITLIDNGADQLLAIRKNAINVHHFAVNAEVPGDVWQARQTTPARFVARGVGGKQPIAWAVADLNQDGHPDYCLSAPELAQIMVHFGGARELHPFPHAIDSLRRIRTLGVDRQGDLYVFSPEENAIACHPAGRLEAFPTFVELSGTPLMMAVPQWHHGFFTLIRDKQQRLLFSSADRNGIKRSVPIDLPENQPPEAMRAFPVAKGVWGVVLFSTLKKPRMYLWNGRHLKPVSKREFRALGASLTPEDIGVVGTPRAPGIVISEGKTTRLYHLAGRQFEIKRQFSLPDEKAVLKFGTQARGPGGLPGYLFYNTNDHELCWFAEDERQKTVCVTLEDDYRELAGILPIDFESGQGLLLPGRNETRWVPADARRYTLQTFSDYTSPAENPKLWRLCPLRLGNPPRTMAAALDAQNAAIELLSAVDGELVEAVSFQVFQGPQFNREDKGWYYEPREVATGDLNADGRMDLGILVHDKLVIHMGE